MNEKKIVIFGTIRLPKILGVNCKYYNLYNLLPRTWKKRFEIVSKQIENDEIEAVIIYFPTPLFLQATQEEFYPLWSNFLPKLEKTKAMILAYEENLHENFNYYDYSEKKYLNYEEIKRRLSKLKKNLSQSLAEYSESDLKKEIEDEELELYNLEPDWEDYEEGNTWFYATRLKLAKSRIEDYQNRKAVVSKFVDEIVNSETEVVAFQQKSEVLLRIEEFIEEVINGVFFNIYIPKEQMLSDEFDQFLKIFERYLQKVENLGVSIDAQSTSRGLTYKFKSKNSSSSFKDIKEAIRRFDDFMQVCNDTPELAYELLSKKFDAPSKALEIIQDFSTKYRRLIIDVEHQKQRMQLLMQQGVENRLLELDMYAAPSKLLEKTSPFEMSIFKNDDFTIIVDRVHNKYSKEEKRILELAKKYGSGEEEVVKIKSQLEQVKDEELPLKQRKSAGQKIKSFLFKAGKKAVKHAEDIGVKILTKYLENLMNGNQ